MGKCIKIDSSWIESLKIYKPNTRRYIYEAIIMYCYNGEVVDMPENAKSTFDFIKSQIDKRSKVSATVKSTLSDKRQAQKLEQPQGNLKVTSRLPQGNVEVEGENLADNQGIELPPFLNSILSADKVKERERKKEKKEETEKESFPPHPLYKEKDKEENIKKENKEKENTHIYPNNDVSNNSARTHARTRESYFHPPDVEQVREYCNSRHSTVNPEKFISFYQSKGWMIGKNKMKDWKAAVRTWEIQNRKNNGNNQTSDNSKFRDSKNVYETKSDF